MNTNSFFRAFLFCITVVLFASCDKDFNEIGSDIVGDDHFGFTKDSLSTVVAYNQPWGEVQTNKTTASTTNLSINALGYYNNPIFGKTKASFVTQLSLGSANPDFGDSPIVRKVELTIPYFSTLSSSDDDGNASYVLDSIYGSSKIKLGVYESGYYLRDLDPDTQFQQVQKYYSNQTPEIDAVKGQMLNDSTDTSQNSGFFFDPAEVVTYKIVNGLQQVDTRTAPEMRLRLNKQFFQDKIFGTAAAGQLINQNVFNQYFRGLYFKVENAATSPDQGSLAQMNFAQGKITITYSVLTGNVDSNGHLVLGTDGLPERKDETYLLNLAGNTVNLFENENSPNYTSGVTNVNTTIGDQRLYLKGGPGGSMAVIDLFGPDNNGNGVADELDNIRNNGWLINDASLSFYIDNASMGTAVPEPNRIYLYDLTNRRQLIDYYDDVTTLSANPKFNKYIHGGIIEKNADGRGTRYKIRITDHIKNLAKADLDSTNVRLGLVVTESIGNVSNVYLKTPVSSIIDRIPAAAAGNPLGTILYGSRPEVPENKRLKLIIYYTKPN